jgi:hypothetical protein
LKAVEAVRDAGAEIALVFTMVDREEGAAEPSRKRGWNSARSTRPANSEGVIPVSLPSLFAGRDESTHFFSAFQPPVSALFHPPSRLPSN